MPEARSRAPCSYIGTVEEDAGGNGCRRGGQSWEMRHLGSFTWEVPSQTRPLSIRQTGIRACSRRCQRLQELSLEENNDDLALLQ